ncbi:MAG: phenylacetate--CoA ligase family protein, partial [Deltaproteobacteria bacterium]|nr:phenylacetate--CoA ligase family protein [Deltaproteobacteria bacterium]
MADGFKAGVFHDLELESPEDRRARKRKALNLAVERAVRHCPEFGDRLAKAGLKSDDVLDEEGFARIPALRKTDIIRLQAEKGVEYVLSQAPGEFSRIFQSPGPIYDFEGRERDHWGWAEAFFACGFRPGDLVQMTFGYHLTPAGLMLEEPLRIIGCGVIPAGPGNTNVQLELLKTLPVNGFVGMASYLKVIGEKAMQTGLDPVRDFKLRTAFVAAERLPDELRSSVEAMFGITVRQGYGTADVGCIAYECSELSGMHVSSHRLVEICDPQTALPVPDGQVGE